MQLFSNDVTPAVAQGPAGSTSSWLGSQLAAHLATVGFWTLLLTGFGGFFGLRLVMGLWSTRGDEAARAAMVSGIRYNLESVVFMVLRPLLSLFERVPGFTAAKKWFSIRFSDEAIEAWFNAMFKNHSNALVRGDLEAVRERVWPQAKYPHLWRDDIPEDLARPLITDGRLPDGRYPGEVLGAKFVDKALVGQVFRRSVGSGILRFALVMLLWHPTAYLSHVREWLLPIVGSHDAVAANSNEAVDELPRRDFRSMAEFNAAMHEQASRAADKMKVAADVEQSRRDSIINSAPGPFWPAVFFALLTFLGSWRGQVRNAAQVKIDPLLRESRERITRWKWRLDQRAMELKAFNAQLDNLKWDTSPLIDLGQASGIFRFRGHLNAPMKDAPVRMSINDLSQHMVVFGGTGSGKTSRVLAPICRQFLKLRKAQLEAGNQRGISMYVTDGKSVLWRDIQKVAIEEGQGDDVRVIGCDTATGQYGVDVLNGVPPQLVADCIQGVMRQAKAAGESDSFWPDMASHVIANVAAVARAYEMTYEGMKLVGLTGERIYSLVQIYKLTLDRLALDNAITAVLDALDDPTQYLALAEYAGIELFDAIQYLEGQWRDLVPATRNGIEANITNAMSAFSSNWALRKAFASGGAERIISVQEAWGSLCMVALSDLEQGMAARIVNVMLKNLLYTESRKREIADPTIGQREKLLFLGDEFHTLLTSAGGVGLDDSSYWSVARSSGVIGLVAVQGLASIVNRIGQNACDTFIQQCRSKIFLRSEDPATLQFARDLSGSTMRFRCAAWDEYESVEAMERETGYQVEHEGPARLDSSPDAFLGAAIAGLSMRKQASRKIQFEHAKWNVDLDTRFITAGGWFNQTDGHTLTSQRQAAYWRQEDRERHQMETGIETVETLHNTDLINGMGGAFAYMHLSRLNATRQDLVEL